MFFVVVCVDDSVLCLWVVWVYEDDVILKKYKQVARDIVRQAFNYRIVWKRGILWLLSVRFTLTKLLLPSSITILNSLSVQFLVSLSFLFVPFFRHPTWLSVVLYEIAKERSEIVVGKEGKIVKYFFLCHRHSTLHYNNSYTAECTIAWDSVKEGKIPCAKR